MKRLSLRLRGVQRGSHVHARVFAVALEEDQRSEDYTHGKAGDIVLRVEEWSLLFAAVAAPGGCDHLEVSMGEDPDFGPLRREPPSVGDAPRWATKTRPGQAFVQEVALGCGDHSCRIRRPSGQGTNGGCRCGERIFDLMRRHERTSPDTA